MRYLNEQSVDSPKLPLEPVVTSWHTWFNSVKYHVEYHQFYYGFMEHEWTEHGDTFVLEKLASLLVVEDMHTNLKYIAEHCGFLVTVLDVLQSHKHQICKVYNIVLDLILWLEHLASSSDHANGSATVQSTADKLRQYNLKNKQPAIDFLHVFLALDPKQIGAAYICYETMKQQLKLSDECNMEWPVYLGIAEDAFWRCWGSHLLLDGCWRSHSQPAKTRSGSPPTDCTFSWCGKKFQQTWGSFLCSVSTSERQKCAWNAATLF